MQGNVENSITAEAATGVAVTYNLLFDVEVAFNQFVLSSSPHRKIRLFGKAATFYVDIFISLKQGYETRKSPELYFLRTKSYLDPNVHSLKLAALAKGTKAKMRTAHRGPNTYL